MFVGAGSPRNTDGTLLLMPETGPADLLRRVVAAEPSRPLVTFYDDAAGERIELSAKTFDNWVAKTANLLVDGLDAEPGERVALALPPHWQTAVWLFACWSAGLVVEPVAEPTEPGDLAGMAANGAEIVVVAGAGLTVEAPAARDIVGLSLHAMGAPLQDCPPGVLDYAAEVRSYGDRFAPYSPIDPDAPMLVMADPTAEIDELNVTKATFSGSELVEQARESAQKWGLDAQSRVLVDMPFTTLQGLLAGLIAPIHAGGSVIICLNLDKAILNKRVSVEHVTAVAGVAGWDEPSVSVRRLT
jgi:uncharacterized protein (TIGR03089 family)